MHRCGHGDASKCTESAACRIYRGHGRTVANAGMEDTPSAIVQVPIACHAPERENLAAAAECPPGVAGPGSSHMTSPVPGRDLMPAIVSVAHRKKPHCGVSTTARALVQHSAVIENHAAKSSVCIFCTRRREREMLNRRLRDVSCGGPRLRKHSRPPDFEGQRQKKR